MDNSIQAFPAQFDFTQAEDLSRQTGMTLRDYFAGQALMGMHARDTFDKGQATPQQRSSLAYIDADAMIFERDKQ